MYINSIMAQNRETVQPLRNNRKKSGSAESGSVKFDASRVAEVNRQGKL